ncbi:MAG: hypothetical protein HYV35_08795 [Lentisphaerae bacterium]|nr:hypothetical protein [Lentisphaerota bacterium]
MNRWKVIFRYALVLALGVVIGLIGSHVALKHRLTRIMRDRPGAQREMLMRHLTRQLELTKPQQREIERIVNARLETLAELRERQRPEIRAIFQRSADEMKAHLTSEQQQKLERMMSRLSERSGQQRGLKPGRNPRYSDAESGLDSRSGRE